MQRNENIKAYSANVVYSNKTDMLLILCTSPDVGSWLKNTKA